MTVVTRLYLACILALPLVVVGAEIKIPSIADPRLELTLVSRAPDLVTPIGIAIDKNGQVFIVESHTHFPKPDYAGPKKDRVMMFQDTNKDGIPDKHSVFADGFHHAMNLAFAPDGVLYLVHRNGVLRLEDKNGDGKSDAPSTILQMETPGTYPHNGLTGIAFSHDGWLYIGQGENLGEGYTLKGSDGSSHSGKAEGGNVFRCRPDGSQLHLFATGFWNPFGLAFYGRQFLLAVDNDPDSRPPNRLLDVVMDGDYGFKFRFGRSGLHPFQSWNGELPGTLPMIGAAGEAASGILTCDQTGLPPEYREAILVTAPWDHRIEIHRPKPFGASLRADRDVLVQGDESFRPIGIASAPDGSVYFTDWVDPRYNVHGQGRLWRLSVKPGPKIKPGSPLNLGANASRRKMERLATASSVNRLRELRASLDDGDPFIRSAATIGLAKPMFRAAVEKELENPSPAIRLGALLALRRAGISNATEVISNRLADADEQVRRLALVWAGEQQLIALTNRIGVALSAGPVSATLLSTHAATASILAKAAKIDPATSGGTGAGQVTFFDLNEPSTPQPSIEVLKASVAKTPLPVRLEAVRQLANTTNAVAIALLKRIVADAADHAELRCEAIVSLAGGSLESRFLIALLDDASPEVRVEAARGLRGRARELPVRDALRRKLEPVGDTSAALTEQARFVLAGADEQSVLSSPMPRPVTDEEWSQQLAGNGDAASGRRIFFNTTVGCARCHRVEGHGGQIGPDLSAIVRGGFREKLIQSMLHPSYDIAPQFVSHTIETKDGQEFTGLLIGQSAIDGATLSLADGRAVLIPPALIKAQSQSDVSLMPEDLENALTIQDFRDLLAFLLSRK